MSNSGKYIFINRFGMNMESNKFSISPENARWQRINLIYWFANCKCECKSCYEMRKSLKALMELEE